jgi:hypothetical protein
MRPILLYLSLVGIPVLGILGLLRMGQTLSAPVSLAGTWSAQLSLPDPHDSPGGDPLLHSGSTILSVSQSGPHLLISFDDNQRTTLVGNVHDVMINASALRPVATATTEISTSRPTAIYFHARVDHQTEPDRLLGILIFDDGASRTEMPFTAIRQGGVRKATGDQ